MSYTERYVTATATGGGNGLAEGTAWTLDEAAANVATGQRINVKAGAYSRTTGVTFATGGPYAIQGYTTTPGDGGRTTIDGGTSGVSYTVITVTGAAVTLADFEFKNNGASGSATWLSWGSQRGLLARVTVRDCRGNGILVSNGPTTLVEVETYGCNQANAAFGCGVRMDASATLLRCNPHDNTGSNSSGFAIGNNTLSLTFIDCISESNGQYGINSGNTTSIVVVGGIYRNNGADGIRDRHTNSVSYYENAIVTLNGGYGFENTSVTAVSWIRNVAYRSNTSGNVQTPGFMDESGPVTLTGDPFVDGPNGDFRLNNTAGGGAACRAAGRGTFTQTQAGYGGTNNYVDIGAAQHADPTQPTIGNVRVGIVYNDGGSTGTMTEPVVGDVRFGTTYGAGGNEFTGTYSASAVVPAAPTLAISDNTNGTGATATVTGSTAGSTNTVYYALVSLGTITLVPAGNRIGDGTIALSVPNGVWLFQVLSTLSPVSTRGGSVYAAVTGGLPFGVYDNADGTGLVVSLNDPNPATVYSAEFMDAAKPDAGWTVVGTRTGPGPIAIPAGDQSGQVSIGRSYFVRVQLNGAGYTQTLAGTPTAGYDADVFQLMVTAKNKLLNNPIDRIDGRVYLGFIDDAATIAVPDVPFILITTDTEERGPAQDNRTSAWNVPIHVVIADNFDSDTVTPIEWWLYSRKKVFDLFDRRPTDDGVETQSGRKWVVMPGLLQTPKGTPDINYRQQVITLRTEIERPIGVP